MRIFFGLGDADLFASILFQYRSQGVTQIICLKYNVNVLIILVVFGEGGVVQIEFFHSEFRQVNLGEYLCDLPTAIGAEVKTDHGIARIDLRQGLMIVIHDDGRQNEFIRDVLLVGLLNGGCGTSCGGSGRLHQCIICQLHAFPALVTVHGVVTTAHGSDAGFADDV